MATGRIGVTPTLGVRWSKAPTGGTTALSGLDDSSVSLVYSVGYEQVYRNGVLLSRGNDYTATTGTTITLIDATITGDIIEVFAQQLVPLADAISKGQFTAKGTLLSATAASTPGVLGVGANGTVLTAASGQVTGLEWATPSSGGMTLLSTTTLSGNTTITISSINQSFTNLMVYIFGVTNATSNSGMSITPNGTGGIADYMRTASATSVATNTNDSPGFNDGGNILRTSADNAWAYTFYNYSSTTANKNFQCAGGYLNTLSVRSAYFNAGQWRSNTAISSLQFDHYGGTFSTGTVLIYGVK